MHRDREVSPTGNSAGACPRATMKKTPLLPVGRGPVPRHAAIARDRPPRYGKNSPLHRRARACPSPCVLLSERITSVGQDRLILTRSGAGEPELQRWARCLPVGGTSLSRYTTSTKCIETGRALLPGCIETGRALLHLSIVLTLPHPLHAADFPTIC